MPVVNAIQYPRTAYVHLETNNQSFLNMHYYLKDIGIKNNAFFLYLLDTDLIGVDPRDPNLSLFLKQKIMREVQLNYWYFIREVIRIPVPGKATGVQYELHRGNLALNFGFQLNWNMYLELPRQNNKTGSALCRFLWEYLIGTSNSEMMFMNKKHDDAKRNLRSLKEIRDLLPSYMRLNTQYGADGAKLKVRDNVESLEHPVNKNKIVTKASARSRASANSLGRGCTQPRQWYDEHAFIPYIGEIQSSATPAFVTASNFARSNGAPFGILITTTPGFLTDECGISSNYTRTHSTPFFEGMYDKTPQELADILNANETSTFVYIRFTYQQLGRGEDYFKRMVKELEGKYTDIRREVLLEWSAVTENSPFTKEDLNIVEGLVREPIKTLLLCGKYQMGIYKEMILDPSFPPIIGVDVSGGFSRDSSAITVIDSKTTDVIATLNNNSISIPELAKCIYELVTKYMGNAIVNVERNGGFGASVLSLLVQTKIKKNLYFEIKDRVLEERTMVGGTISRKTQKTKVYGFDSSKNNRELVMEILRDRMQFHKDKFIARIIYDELQTLEVKKSGKIEHANDAHDDQIFSYLMALYVWVHGQNLVENFGLCKTVIKTDEDLDKSVYDIEEKVSNIISDIELLDDEDLQKQLKAIQIPVKSMAQFQREQEAKDDEALKMLISTNKAAAKAYAAKNFTVYEENKSGITEIPVHIFENFYNENIDDVFNTEYLKR